MAIGLTPATAYMYAAACMQKEFYDSAENILLQCVGIAPSASNNKIACANEVEDVNLPSSFCVSTHGFDVYPNDVLGVASCANLLGYIHSNGLIENSDSSQAKYYFELALTLDDTNSKYAASLAKNYVTTDDKATAITYCSKFLETSSEKKLTTEEKDVCITAASEIINSFGEGLISGDMGLDNSRISHVVTPMFPPFGLLINGGYASSLTEFNELSDSHATYGSYVKHCTDLDIDATQEMKNFCPFDMSGYEGFSA